jgi:hypothetical protein
MKTTILIIALLIIGLKDYSQTNQEKDSIISIEKAMFLKEDLAVLLSKNTEYPKEGLSNNIQGDVFVSCIIDKNGKLNSLTIESSPDLSLSKSTMIACKAITEEWSPAKINNVPIDKKYLFIFRYRMYMDTQPVDYKSNADKRFANQDYKKALQLYDKAIGDNPYDYKLFESRSKVKELLGDQEGAKRDLSASARFRNEIMTVINVRAIGITRVQKIGVTEFR